MTVKKEIINKVLADLNLTNRQVMEEGFFSRLGNKVMGVGSSIRQGINNLGQQGAASPANVARNVSNFVGNQFQTDKAIIQAGLLFKDKNGRFVGISNVDPKSPEGSFLTQQYTNEGYIPATAEDRFAASRQKIVIHRPENMLDKNLKLTTTGAMEKLKNLASQLERTVASKPVFTDQDANKIYQQLVQFIKTSIADAKAAMPVGPENPANLVGLTGATAAVPTGATGAVGGATGAAVPTGVAGAVGGATGATGAAVPTGVAGVAGGATGPKPKRVRKAPVKKPTPISGPHPEREPGKPAVTTTPTGAPAKDWTFNTRFPNK